MGLVIGCLSSCVASCVASCACSACASCISAACCSCCRSDGEHSTKQGSTTWKHLILFTLSVIVAIILRYQNDGLIHIYTYSWNACTSNDCVGYAAVWRITFTLFLYFFVHAFLLMFTLFSRLDRISWFWHYLVFIGLLVGCWAIPSVFYDQAWMNIARFLSVPFLFFQIVILVDFAYEWNASWTRDTRPKPMLVLVVILGIVFIMGALALCGLYFHWYAAPGCDRNQFFASWTIIEIVLLTILSISPWIAEGTGGILPSGVISLYLAWLAYSGFESDPSSCNTVKSHDTLHLVLGLCVGALSLVYAAYNVATNNSLFGGEDAQPVNEAAKIEEGVSRQPAVEMSPPAAQSMDAAAPSPQPAGGALGATPAVEEDSRLLAKRNFRFHALMCCCSTYMAMLLTNWGSMQQASDLGPGQTAYDQGVESVFIKFASQWLCFFVYMWSLFAPIVLKDREFTVNR